MSNIVNVILAGRRVTIAAPLKLIAEAAEEQARAVVTGARVISALFALWTPENASPSGAH